MMVDGDGRLLGRPLVGIANFDFYGAYVEEMVKASQRCCVQARRRRRDKGAIVSQISLLRLRADRGCSPVGAIGMVAGTLIANSSSGSGRVPWLAPLSSPSCCCGSVASCISCSMNHGGDQS